ncbi:tail fiber assembly protein [Kosakonia cowanii]|jgi:hypothetical protein|uniref:tail fiber assembly protein n=1 Tax=Kosakonia cowanii TaxID=208223 RepID=UPI001E3606AA|nr:tail fiber assembly protein [Kosakonia cowanii]UGS44753.1 tail fiber assembly protein [Kosakonia cowanii]
MYYYSAKHNTFIPEALKQDYIDAGTFFEDAKEVADEIWAEFAGGVPPEGKMRIPGKKGLPAWADIPPPEKDDLIQLATEKKQKLLSSVNAAITPLLDAVELGIATEEESESLQALKTYRVLLNRVDVTAPVWPEVPADVA